MIYKYFKPSPALREFVRDILVAHFTFDTLENIPFKPYSPKPEQTITFLPRGHLIINNPSTGENFKTSQVSIGGQQISRLNFFLSQEYLMVRVHFLPGNLYRLLGVPLTQFTDVWFDAESVIGGEVIEVNNRLSNCTDYAEMISVVETFLFNRIKNVKLDEHPLDKVVTAIYHDPSEVSLNSIASQAWMSPRQFHRKFIQRMGIGPKLYSRIVRFYKAYIYKELHTNERWESIALRFGYSDYQHMAKDFKQFANLTPGLWIDQDNMSPERILHLEEQDISDKYC